MRKCDKVSCCATGDTPQSSCDIHRQSSKLTRYLVTPTVNDFSGNHRRCQMSELGSDLVRKIKLPATIAIKHQIIKLMVPDGEPSRASARWYSIFATTLGDHLRGSPPALFSDTQFPRQQRPQEPLRRANMCCDRPDRGGHPAAYPKPAQRLLQLCPRSVS